MKKIVTILSALFISIGCFVGMSGHELVGYADQKDHVLTLNSTNGAIKAASYQGSVSKTSANTKQNNTINFESVYGLTRTNELGQLKDDGTAYYRNITPITGIYKIDVNYAFSGSSGKCYLSLGSQNGTSFVEAEEFAFDASKGANVYSTQTFTNFKTDYSYFKIHRETDSNRAIYIKNIDIYYYCNGVPSTPTTPTVSVSGVTVTPETLSIEKGNTFGLTSEVLPNDANDKSVTWSSNNTNVATVDELGVVTGVGKGSATITCTTNDGGFTDTCLVTVTEKEVVTTTSYKLVEGANQLVDGAKVALVSRSSGKIAGPVSSQYLTSVSFDTLTSDTTEFENIPSGALELTLEKSGTSWKFKNSSDQYLGATAVKKIAFGQGTTTWSISISSGSATIQNATSSYGRFLYNVSSPRFTTYASATSATMLLPELFIQTTTEGGEEEPDTPVVPEEPVVTLSSLEASLTKDTYKVGDTFDKNSVTIAGIMSDGSTQNYTFNDIDEYTCYDEDLNDINLDSPLATEGEYVLTVTIDDVESDTLSFYVEAEEVVPSGSTATITIGSSSSTSNDLGDNAIDCLTVNGVTISSVSGSKIFGLGSSTPGFKLGSGSATGTITFNFSNEIVISGISLKIGRYNSKSSSVKVSTSANTTGETISLGSDEYISSPYVCSNFTSNTVASKSLTIATASSSSDKRFQLYEITLTIGVAQKVDVTGVNISQESLSIGVGSTFQLSANVLPTNASNKIVTWSTSSSNIASISNTGIVSGVAVGTATISVKTEEGGFTDNVTVTVTQVAYDSYYKATTVDPDFNYKDIQESQDCSSIPAGSGDRNILVVPVELTDYEFTQETLDDIEIAFNGDSSNTYWESVASFYEKSSYGKMHLNFEIADVYESGMSAKTMSRIEVDEQNYFYFTQHVVEDVIDDYKTKNGNSSTKQFDSDSDGFIDAVWMIYSCPNYSNESGLSDEYWAYVYWNNWNESASFSSPVAGAYGWASYDFMYEKGDTKIDAHTYIHETGHLFGLDDYYNYDKGRTSLGGVDMMDFNVIDHNSWSKMALGWTKPYIVTGNAEITISAAVDSGDCILIPDATSGWNGTSFDEFILLELYSPTGLNAKDATTSYNSANVYTQPGIRLYHVDSRLARYAYSSSKGWQFSTYIEPSGFVPGTYYYYCPAASNTPSYSENEDYELIHMIQAGGTDTFSYGGSANNSDLFKTGQTFSMSAYGSKFFANGTKFNNGNDFGYTITFVSVSSTSATIRITKA